MKSGDKSKVIKNEFQKRQAAKSAKEFQDDILSGKLYNELKPEKKNHLHLVESDKPDLPEKK